MLFILQNLGEKFFVISYLSTIYFLEKIWQFIVKFSWYCKQKIYKLYVKHLNIIQPGFCIGRFFICTFNQPWMKKNFFLFSESSKKQKEMI